MNPTERPILGARQYAWITFGFALFVIYGSLVPLDYRPISLSDAAAKFERALSRPVKIAERSDWLANILLFIPLGFTAMGWLSVDRRRPPALPIGLLLPAFSTFSALIEFTQIWFPARHTSLNDIIAETMGGAFGIGLWLAFGQTSTDYLRKIWSTHGRGNWALRLIPGYLVVLFFVHGMPFDLTLSVGLLKMKYHMWRILPIPFTIQGEPLDLVRKALINFAYFLPAGILIAGLPGRIATGRNAAWRVLGLGVLLASAIEGMQMFVLSRYCDATDIITGSLAVLTGWTLMRIWHDSRAEEFSGGPRAVFFLIWVAALVFINWEPFDFRADSDFLMERWRNLSFVPFADYYAGNYLDSFNEIIQKTLLFVPFGLFLLPRSYAGWDTPITVASALLLALLIEAGQLFLPRHHPGVSDLLIEPFGAWLGCLAARRLRMSSMIVTPEGALPKGVVVR